MNTDMSLFMGLSPNNDLKKGPETLTYQGSTSSANSANSARCATAGSARMGLSPKDDLKKGPETLTYQGSASSAAAGSARIAGPVEDALKTIMPIVSVYAPSLNLQKEPLRIDKCWSSILYG